MIVQAAREQAMGLKTNEALWNVDENEVSKLFLELIQSSGDVGKEEPLCG